MASKKNGVKRTKGMCPAELMLKNIELEVKKFNALNTGGELTELFLTTTAERKIEAAKLMSYGEQYSADIACLAIHEAFGIGEQRMIKYNDAYRKFYKEFADLFYEDGKIDAERDYATACFERKIKEAVGNNYQPREVRYKVEVKFNGLKVENE